MNRNTLWLIGMLTVTLGMFGRGILGNRVLGLHVNTQEQVLELLDISGGMAAAAVALALEALESCAVPIFAMLLVEGFEKTSDVKKYILRVSGVAVISELPYNFALTGVFWDPSSKNPVFAMVLALIMLYLYRYYADNQPQNMMIKLLVTVAALIWAVMFGIDYGLILLIVVWVLWVFRERPLLRYLLASAAAISCCIGKPLYMFAPFGFLLVYFYNGEQGPVNKVLHYMLYPFMLLMVGLAGFTMF